MRSVAIRLVWLGLVLLMGAVVWAAPGDMAAAQAPGEDASMPAVSACPAVEPGSKGLQAHPNEFPAQLAQIAAADAGWIRLEFLTRDDGTLDLDRYSATVDGLCQQGIGVLALVDYATIPEDLDGDGSSDYDDPDEYLAYQQRFVATVRDLAVHFRGRIRHWEIWNEQNGLQWHIRPEYYARLLVQVSQAVKEVDPENRIVFGGLEHVWATSQYLEPVYDALDTTWGGARPFDILALHPYAVRVDGQYILDPSIYLWDGGDPAHTALDPYLALMAARGDGDKPIWITEIGWNSALGNPAIARCPGMEAWSVTRSEQAAYLADSMDILFGRVEDPLGRHDRVQTVFWYQYQDTAISLAQLARKLAIPLQELTASPLTICPADWGLVDGNRVPKQSYWAYQIYPQRMTGWALASFVARGEEGTVRLSWTTVDEQELTAFSLFRAATAGGPRLALVADLRPQAPGSPSGATYEFLDRNVAGGVPYFYYLEALDTAATALLFGPVRAAALSDSPIIGLAALSDSPTLLGQPTTFTATVEFGGGVSHTWTFGDGLAAGGAVVTHTYTRTGDYAALVTARNAQGAVTATVGVEVLSPDHTCWAKLDALPTRYSSVQAAVAASTQASDLIRVSGTCTGAVTYGGQSQQVYLDRTLTLRGGYAPDLIAWDPEIYPTTLDARGQGRALFITPDAQPTLEHVRITGGAFDGLGGGLYAARAGVTIRDCQIVGNQADAGGGLYLWQSDGAVLTGNRIEGNRALDGGGVYVQDSSGIELAGNQIRANEAVSGTGGLVLEGSDVDLANNLVVDNRGPTAGGIDARSGSARLVHTTVARNLGSGLRVESGAAWLTNTVLVSNTVGVTLEVGSASLVATLWGAGPWANGTDWAGAGELITGTANLRAEPDFVDAEAGDYHLAPGSAAIDAGVDAGLRQDIDGEFRPFGAAPDLGADERATIEVVVQPDAVTTLQTQVGGFVVTLTAPAGAVTESVALRLTAPATAGHPAPGTFAFAGLAFDLDAYRQGVRLPGFAFGTPVGVVIEMDGRPVEHPPSLWVWQEVGGAWLDAAWTCAPPTRSEWQPDEQRLTTAIGHLSRFGLFARTRFYTHLPIALRR